MPNTDWQRLKKRTEFLTVQKQGQAVKLPAFVVLYKPSASHVNRVGFTATKRIIGNAVRRNRAKRRMRSLVEITLKKACLTQNQPVDMVLIARSYILQRNFDTMAQELTKALIEQGFECENNG